MRIEVSLLLDLKVRVVTNEHHLKVGTQVRSTEEDFERYRLRHPLSFILFSKGNVIDPTFATLLLPADEPDWDRPKK